MSLLSHTCVKGGKKGTDNCITVHKVQEVLVYQPVSILHFIRLGVVPLIERALKIAGFLVAVKVGVSFETQRSLCSLDAQWKVFGFGRIIMTTFFSE